MINNLIKLAKEKDISLEVCTFKSEQYNVATLNDELTEFNIPKLTEYTIKAIYNGKTSYINTEKIDNPEKIITEIINCTNLKDNDNKNRLCENDFEIDVDRKANINLNQIKKELFKLNKYYHDKFAFIVNAEFHVGYEKITRMIDNEKHHMKDSYSYFNVYLCISAKKDNDVKNEYISIYDNEFNVDRIKAELDKLVNKLELSLNAESIKTVKGNVLIENYPLYRILYAFINSFYSKQLDMKISPFAGKLGEKLFSDKVTIVEEPLNKNFIVNRHFDNEGTLTYNKEIVKNGVFKTAFNTIEYAIKNNEKPTGNTNMVSNFYIKPGNKSYDELLGLMKDGIIINNVEGTHSGINLYTGDISLQATGYLVKDEKVVKALDMIILQTNIFELLTNVTEIGSDFKEFGSTCSSSSILVHDITVSGNL